MEANQNGTLDGLDKAILQELQANGRISNAELASRITLSPAATLVRIRRLEQQGYIRQYTALLDPEKAGYDMICFVHISLQVHQSEQIQTIQSAIQEIPEVLECYHVTGEFDYLLKVIVRHRKDLQRFIVHRLTPIPGVARIYTSLALSEIKSTTVLPVD